MANKQESTCNLEQLRDTEIYAAIRDLDPDPSRANEQGPEGRRSSESPEDRLPMKLMAEGLGRPRAAVLVIWFSLVILLGFVCFLLARNALF